MRRDFIKIGLFLLVVGFIVLVMAFDYEAIYRFVRATSFALLALGLLVCIAGLIYLFAGALLRPIKVSRPPVNPSLPEPQTEFITSSKTGPGWHCTWCWAPLPEGSKICNNCGREIK